jgi:hypothetical protein
MAIGDGKAQKETQKINEELGFILDAVASIGDKLVASFEDAVDGADALNNSVEIIGKTMQRGLAADLKAVVKNTNNLIDLGAKVNMGLATQADFAKTSQQIAFSRARLLAKREILAGKLTDKQKELLDAELGELDAQDSINKKLEAKNAKLQKSKSLFQLAKENAGGIADKIDKSGTLSTILEKGIGAVLTPMRLLEVSALALFQAIVSTDKQTGDMAKSMNITYTEANKLQREMSSVANLSMSAKITAEGLGKALMAVNSELGITNTTVNANLVFFQEMHKYAGLTYEELQGVNAITNATGGDLKRNTGEILAQAKIQGTRLGVSLNEKEVLKDISKVSAATTVSLGMSADEIGKAVSVAKSLGLELGKVDNIASSILDFESSIEKELEAELLLGKDINLEKARTAALNNDLATLAEEIAEQAGTAAEFGAMNRIEQEALAAAVGMGREELGEMLFTQEQLVGLSGDELAIREKQINDLQAKGLSQDAIKAKLASQSVSELKSQVSAQENLSSAVSKMKELFVSIAGPVLSIITPIVDILVPAIGVLAIAFEGIEYITQGIAATFDYIAGSVTGMYDMLTGANAEMTLMQSIIGAIAISYGLIAAYNATIAVSSAVRAATEGMTLKSLALQVGKYLIMLPLAISNAVAAITGASATTLGVAAVIALAAGAAAYAFLADDLVSEGQGTSGYGKRTLMGPEGAIALNNKDTVIAGTNLFPKGDDVMSAPAGEIQMPAPADNSRMEGLLESLVRDQRARPVIANPGVIQIQ